jgi:large subunit ribosomal protein L15
MRKRKKIVKFRGSKTHGYGSEKKHRGKGSRGGVGMAGSKDHKKFMILKEKPGHIGKYGFHSLKKRKMKPSVKSVNVRDLPRLAEKGVVDLDARGFYKVLGAGELKEKLTVKARAFSSKAEEKITRAGGKAIKAEQKTG